MIRRYKKLIIILLIAILPTVAVVVSQAPQAHAQVKRVDNCRTNETNAFNPSGKCQTALPQVRADRGQIQNGLAIAFGMAAGVALISLAIASFNYATAATDTEKIARSKKAIVFSLLGLVIALSAEAIVLTVVGRL